MVIPDFSGRSRLDACPGALQMHSAADGGLARIRVPGGRLTAAQLRELAHAAAEHGTGVIELTSRANVQVRGLRTGAGADTKSGSGTGTGTESAATPGSADQAGPESTTAPGARTSAPAGVFPGAEAEPRTVAIASGQASGSRTVSGFADRMARAGLLPSPTHEKVRNILASPLTGCDGSSAVDVGPPAAELDRMLCARPALAALPGRFLFALDDGRGDVAGLGADAGLLPVGTEEAALIVAGADSGLRVPMDAAVQALLAVAEAFLAELEPLAARGITAWRIKELPGGPAAVTARVRAALGLRSGEPVRLRPAVRGPAGIVPGRDGRVALGVTVPLGRLTSAQAEVLADVAASGEVRLTPWRGVVLPGLTRPEAEAAIAGLSGAGLVTGPGSPWEGVSACAGRPGCAKSLADVQADAASAIAAIVASGSAPEGPLSPGNGEPLPSGRGEKPSPGSEGQAPSGNGEQSPSGRGEWSAGEGRDTAGAGGGTLPVHWAGCERRCGRPRGRVVEVVATGDGYRVDLDGRSLTCADIEQTAAAVAAGRGEK
ncbi:precorrin-3B synthase [Planobispora siamensis]|uniref:Nitrite/Sulfite reductase ferredoxin-like domain-containing protein n=1 Tax=Planobispora siamensis TaxID=936338 RepID=A0A8J3SHY0_9ACTN|nr:precorrin-3B synthase [Planobispora siamensis]GIH93300.1 hypothetical protein Psi01_39300 [Planobispora siamensis]